MPIPSFRQFTIQPARRVRYRFSAIFLLLSLIALGGSPALAGPWLDPGDSALRHDVQLLSDAGLVHAPLTTWPLAWEDVVRDIQSFEGNLAPALAAARLRVLREYRKASRIHEVKPHLRVALAHHGRRRRAILDHYGPEVYRRRLERIYKSVRKPVRQRIDKASLCRAFLEPADFSLLKWSPYHA